MFRNVIWTCSSRNLFAGRIQLSSLENYISLIWHLFWLKCGAWIGLWIRNPRKLSLHQLDFWSSRYWILNGQRSTLADCEIWLWRMWFPWSFSFYFCCITFSGTHALHKIPTERQICQLPPIYSFLHLSSKKCLQNIKQRISRHFIYKTWTKH